MRVDAAGGWWDAGDYLKFVETASYTDTVLLSALRDFPRQTHVRVHGSSFAAEAKFGVHWLLRMWDDRTRTLYYQVGIGEGNDHTIGDHDIWRLPQADDHYDGTTPPRATSATGRCSGPGRRARPSARTWPAAMPPPSASASRCYRRTAPALAARCLRSGEHIFALANTHPGRLLTVVPFDFYPETEWRDDLELGATELAIARRTATCQPGCRTGARSTTCVWLRTGHRPTSPGPTTPPTRSTCTT